MTENIMTRSNWHYDHPPACTCVGCNENRLNKKDGFFNRLIAIFKQFFKF